MKILDQQKKTVKRLQEEGFEVRVDVRGASGALYDLVAQRNGQSIVFEFKRQSDLSLESAAITRLRQLAQQDGYSEFRLVVVPEEQTVTVEISGLDSALLNWLSTHPEVTTGTTLENRDVVFRRVEQVQISHLEVEAGHPGANVTGMAVVEFLVFSSRQDDVWDCPLSFDVRLDANWQLESVEKLVMDTSSINEYIQEYISENSAIQK